MDHVCIACGRAVTSEELAAGQAGDAVTFSYCVPLSNENKSIFICSKGCQAVWKLTEPQGCLVCHAPCASSKWYLAVRFAGAGGAMTVQAACSRDCHENVRAVKLDTFDLEYTCRLCGKSSKEKMPRCSKCRFTFYCSQDCQKKDWPKHKLVCE
jgi:hypothetical protein